MENWLLLPSSAKTTRSTLPAALVHCSGICFLIYFWITFFTLLLHTSKRQRGFAIPSYSLSSFYPHRWSHGPPLPPWTKPRPPPPTSSSAQESQWAAEVVCSVKGDVFLGGLCISTLAGTAWTKSLILASLNGGNNPSRIKTIRAFSCL